MVPEGENWKDVEIPAGEAEDRLVRNVIVGRALSSIDVVTICLCFWSNVGCFCNDCQI